MVSVMLYPCILGVSGSVFPGCFVFDNVLELRNNSQYVLVWLLLCF